MTGCCRTLPVVIGVWLLTTVLAAYAGDVNYRDVIVNRPRSDYMSRYFRRLYRRQRHCEEPGLTERVGVADVILTGTVREIEEDRRQPGSEVARVEVKRVIKDHRQVVRSLSFGVFKLDTVKHKNCTLRFYVFLCFAASA